MIQENIEACPLLKTLNSISGKWRIVILYTIYQHKVTRYSELKKSIPNITHKVLSSHLKEFLEMDLITRQAFNSTPPKVEYSLTSKGKKLLQSLQSLYFWGIDNMK